jgi:hypothetical protein
MEKNILPIVMGVVFVVLILLLIKILKRLIKESPGNQWKESFNALAEELNASIKGTKMTGAFEGFSFECSRSPFWIQFQFPLPLELKIKKANWMEKLWKKLGLVLSINTRDPSFDTAFAVRTDNREIAQKILQNDNCREPIKKLLTLFTARETPRRGEPICCASSFVSFFTRLRVRARHHEEMPGKSAREILIRGKKIRINYKTQGALSEKKWEAIVKRQIEMIKESLQQLSQLSHHSAAVEELTLAEETTTQGQVIIRVIKRTILAIVMIGLVLITVGLGQYEPLENFLSPAFKFLFPYLILFTAITLLARYLKLKNSNYLRLEVIETLLSCFILYIFSGMGYFLFTNGYLDNSLEIKDIVSVQDKSKSGRDYFIYFQLSTKEKKETKLEVSESFYKLVKTGDPIIIIYKQGYHHIPWLVSYEKGNP